MALSLDLDLNWTLEPVIQATAGEFHALVSDSHIRRYLMDGREVPMQWILDQIDLSENEFRRSGLGLWLVRKIRSTEAIGFAGFMSLVDTGLEGELVYALREEFTGRGLSTMIASRLIRYAAENSSIKFVSASVDAVNLASVRILEKLGFERITTRTGEFGDLFIYRLELVR